MVVLAASVITKSGKALLSRQFVDMSRMRIEGLLAAFPKLVGIGKQHTYVETDEVRYLYQPLEQLYLLLITTKQSNVLEDLETLRMLVKIVPEYCPSLDETTVCHVAFAVIFAFDEVISQGYRENVTLQQVHQCCEMESQEENLHRMIMQTKINDARDVMTRKAQEIDRNKIEKAKYEGAQGSYSSPTAMGSGPINITGFDMNGDGAGGGFGNGNAFASIMEMESSIKPSTAKVSAAGKGTGMKLGKSQKASKLLESLKAEGEITESDVAPSAGLAKTVLRAAPADPISVVIEEKLTCVLKKEGGLDSLGVMGTISLEVQKEEDAFIRVQLETGTNENFKFRPHPNIDKALYAKENLLGLRDPTKPFPTCTAVGILKWIMQTKDESLVPLTVNCWGSISSGDSFVVEYEASRNFELHNVVFTIPLPAIRDPPSVNEVDGEWRYDARRSVLEWVVEHIDNTNRNGSLEFVVPAADTSVFFPMDVKFTATKLFCDMKATSVVATSGNPVKAAIRTALVVDSYQIV